MPHEEQVEIARKALADLRVAIEAFNITTARCVQTGVSAYVKLYVDKEVTTLWLDRGARITVERAEIVTRVEL